MTKPLTQHLERNTILCPLYVPEGLAEGMCAVITLKRFSPFLEHLINGLPGERLILPIPGLT